VKRLAIALILVFALAACGGSSHPKKSSGPNAQQQIKSTYVRFFSSNTDVAGKVKLLEDGQQFKSVIEVFANNPLASNVSATVSSVTLQGANKAKVVYVVTLGGATLPKLTGTAVRQDGRWKVGNASLCKLIALGGTTPSACKS